MSQHLKWIFFLLCLNQNDERNVLPMASGDASAFSAGEDGILTLFFSFGCYFPEENSQVKGAMSDRLCLYSPSFQGIWSYWKSGDGWQLRDVYVMSGSRVLAVAAVCLRMHACMHASTTRRAEVLCSQIHVISVANHFCSHMTSLPDWFHSAVEGGKIKQMSEIASRKRGGWKRTGGEGGSGVGGCVLERWSEGLKWRERESVI